jgi:hypothetical protein
MTIALLVFELFILIRKKTGPQEKNNNNDALIQNINNQQLIYNKYKYVFVCDTTGVRFCNEGGAPALLT